MNDQFDFPIFTVYGNDYFEEDLHEMIEIQHIIEEIKEDINNSSLKLKELGHQLNFYLNNIINLEKKFKCKNQLIVFTNKTNQIAIYDRDQINDKVELLIQEYEGVEEEICKNLLDNLNDDEILPETDKKFKINNKQYKKLNELVQQYNDLFIQYEYFNYDLNEHYYDYNEILEDIKKSLSKIQMMEIVDEKTYDDEFESFDNDKHDLLITKDKINNKWQLIYLRKENKYEFLDLIKQYS